MSVDPEGLAAEGVVEGVDPAGAGETFRDRAASRAYH